MGNVTRDLSRWEWACRCGCGFDDLHPVAVVGLQDIRTIARVPLIISSGCRCFEHNAAEDGAEFSFHLPQANGYSWAVDWTIPGAKLFEMVGYSARVQRFFDGGTGIYLDGKKVWIHNDTRATGPARWGYLDGQKTDLDKVLAVAAERGV